MMPELVEVEPGKMARIRGRFSIKPALILTVALCDIG